MKKFLDIYNGYVEEKIKSISVPENIKWSRDLKKRLDAGKRFDFEKGLIRDCCYRPFSVRKIYLGTGLVDVPGIFSQFFPEQKSRNLILSFQTTDRFPFSPFVSDKPTDKNLLVSDGAICAPAYYYSNYGERIDNISDWGLKQFREHYEDTTITKEAIFHYIYAVLNNPDYKEKYADNLKTEYPRIPFYDDFHQWAERGKTLMDLHIDYGQIKPYEALHVTRPSEKEEPLLKLSKEEGTVTLDGAHVITGIPLKAFEYKLGNRSPIEWALEGYKPKKYNPDKEEHHKILAAEFNHYDWPVIRAKLLDLIPRLVTVSLETQAITDAMRKQKGLPDDGK